MKSNYLKKTLSFALCVGMSLSLVACGAASTEAQPAEAVADATETAAQTNETEKEDTLLTEEDYRNAISSAASAEEKVALYDSFSSQYMLTEPEFIEYAQLCKEAGDTKKERDILQKLYRVNPSKEHGELISGSCMYFDASDSDAIKILEQLKSALEGYGADDFLLSSIDEVIASQDWTDNFYIGDGVFASHTAYECDSYTADVVSSVLGTDAYIIEGNIALGIKSSAAGVEIFKAAYNGTAFEGEFASTSYDAAGNVIDTKAGTIKDGHCVDEFVAVVDGVEYKGTFDSNGITTCEQQEKVTGVVYAYDAKGKNFLYVVDADAATWTADEEFVGLGDLLK